MSGKAIFREANLEDDFGFLTRNCEIVNRQGEAARAMFKKGMSIKEKIKINYDHAKGFWDGVRAILELGGIKNDFCPLTDTQKKMQKDRV